MNEGNDGGFKVAIFQTERAKIDLKGERCSDGAMKEAFGIANLDENFDFSLGCNACMSDLEIHMVLEFSFPCGSCKCINFMSELGINIFLMFNFS